MWYRILVLFFVAELIVSNASNQNERTFLMIKPDGVQRGLIGQIIKRFEDKGFKLIALKMIAPNKQIMMKHYIEKKGRPFYPNLIQYMTSGPVVVMVWEGLNIIEASRLMLGATDPTESNPGTIRGDLSIDIGRNLIHGSDTDEAARKEIAMWFDGGEIVEWTSMNEKWVYW